MVELAGSVKIFQQAAGGGEQIRFCALVADGSAGASPYQASR
jgi:hypothetical protein